MLFDSLRFRLIQALGGIPRPLPKPPPELDKGQLDSFERGFSSSCGSCRTLCHCGRIYWHDERCYSWDEGEREELRENPDATGLDYCPGYLHFQGADYVDACDCWHRKAAQIIGFIEDHKREISSYLKHEKARLVGEAANLPSGES